MRVIWERFPKFVLGFMVSSLVFSLLVDANTVKATKSLIGGLRTWWFALAFTSIGLETKFTDLLSMEGGRPFVAFLGGAVRQSDMDSAPGLPDLRRCLLRPSVDLVFFERYSAEIRIRIVLG